MLSVSDHLERLRLDHEAAECDGDLLRRLRIVENAARLAQANGLAVPDWAAFRVEVIRNVYRDQLRMQFEHTRNPMYAVQGYIMARNIGDHPPIWVLNYLDVAIGRFFLGYVEFTASKGRPNRPDKALCEAFGVVGTGRGTIWSTAAAGEPRGRWRVLGATVASILAEWGQEGGSAKESAAIDEAVRRCNIAHRPVSRSTVQRAYKRYQREIADACQCCPVHAEPSASS